MCGRFANQYTLVDLYRITEPYIAPISNLEPRFNFAPMQRGIVVRLDKEGLQFADAGRGIVMSAKRDGSRFPIDRSTNHSMTITTYASVKEHTL
jgi:putative SOS response-associated peptidase YedK